MEPLALLNGEFLPQAEATLALNDAGFVFGAAVTDLCRTFRHQPYRWSEHLTRFRRSCLYTHIHPPFSDDDITRWALYLVGHNADLLGAGQELALVLFATPGPVGYYLGEPGGVGEQPATFGMHTFPLPFDRYRSLLEKGATLVIPTVRHVPGVCVDRRVKQRSRIHWWLAEVEARQVTPGAQALLLDEAGHLTETAGANLLLVRDGALVSPPRASILEGISLGVVGELARGLGIPLRYEPLTPYDALTADEAILTSTPYCLVGVRRLQQATLPCPGLVTERLLQAWNDEVGLDIHQQILGGA
jgi:branched-subunit amino acid aminotransferase/4-amino-4-deoxychorismate lyase